MSRLTGRAAAGGFTLIELLMVVAIVALLVTIVVPTLSQAREHAKNALCRNNLGQMRTLLHSSKGDGDLALPVGFAWLGFVTAHGAGDTVVCPKDKVDPVYDLNDLYFVQVENGVRISSYNSVASGSAPDNEIHFESVSSTLKRVYWRGPNRTDGGDCARVEISLGEPIRLEIPSGHQCHAQTNPGRCKSNHYVCYGKGANWQKEMLMQLQGMDKLDDKGMVELRGSSYAMNLEVSPFNTRLGQLLLVEYEGSIIADADADIGQWDAYLDPALRHMGKANFARVDGSVTSMTREQLEHEQSLDGGVWDP